MATRNRRSPNNMRNWTANPSLKLPRSTFNMSRIEKTTFDSGWLIPFELKEVLPGDTWTMRIQSFLRLATPIKPYMDRLQITFHFWFCPNRQLWDNWEKFMGAQDNPGDSTDFLIPQVVLAGKFGDERDDLVDYFGIALSNWQSGNIGVSALPFRMYNRIWNYHYRDADLQDSIPQATGDGPDTLSSDYTLRKRGKRHDYFTSSKSFQQKGQPIPISLATQAPVYTTGADGETGKVETANPANGTAANWIGAPDGTGIPWNFAPGTGNLFASLNDITITQLRNSIAIQHIFERDARGGTRYAEQLVSRFGVTDPALLVLQQPLFLGGGTVPVDVNPVPQTQASPATDVKPENVQGNLAAVGTVMANGIGFTQSFTEHGWIMGLMCAHADLTYQQGTERHWFHRERFDFYTPELAHISEQPVFSKEIYNSGEAGDDDIWGYQGAFDEYRWAISHIKGRFKSTPVRGQPLDFWHLGQNFATRPQLNDAFIQENPPVKRVIAVQTEPEFIGDIFINAKAARIMPITGIPGLTRI